MEKADSTIQNTKSRDGSVVLYVVTCEKKVLKCWQHMGKRKYSNV